MGAVENGHRLVDLPPKNCHFPSLFLFTGGEGPHEFQDPKKPSPDTTRPFSLRVLPHSPERWWTRSGGPSVLYRPRLDHYPANSCCLWPYPHGTRPPKITEEIFEQLLRVQPWIWTPAMPCTWKGSSHHRPGWSIRPSFQEYIVWNKKWIFGNNG